MKVHTDPDVFVEECTLLDRKILRIRTDYHTLIIDIATGREDAYVFEQPTDEKPSDEPKP